jgi:hypothetical protein
VKKRKWPRHSAAIPLPPQSRVQGTNPIAHVKPQNATPVIKHTPISTILAVKSLVTEIDLIRTIAFDRPFPQKAAADIPFACLSSAVLAREDVGTLCGSEQGVSFVPEGGEIGSVHLFNDRGELVEVGGLGWGEGGIVGGTVGGDAVKLDGGVVGGVVVRGDVGVGGGSWGSHGEGSEEGEEEGDWGEVMHDEWLW